MEELKEKNSKFQKILQTYKRKIATKEICKGIVSAVKYDKDLDTEILVISMNGVKGIIKKEDIDLDLNLSTLTNFVGREVSVIVKSINEDSRKIICSRKEAQKLTKNIIINRLRDGEAFDGQIINILPHGAYIEIEGVTGLLKNVDFAEDFTTISEKHAQGDRIKVKLKKHSSNGTLIFETTKKYCNPSTIKPENIEEGQEILGVIRSIKPFGIFVNVAPYLDVLCSPDTEEYEEDKKVVIKITKIENKSLSGKMLKRYRGKIIKIL